MDFNHYFTNQELENLLKEWSERYPEIVRLSVIGESYEKRPLWLLTLTNLATGPDLEKPAVWIDANIHATEIHRDDHSLHLATRCWKATDRPQITRLLDQAVYYIVPRVNPDGAALALADRPRFIRSGVRPYPWQEKGRPARADVDGDGRILQMRLVDPSGDWKVSALDPRLMQKREPHEHGGMVLPADERRLYRGFRRLLD